MIHASSRLPPGMDHIEYVYTVGMSDGEIGRRLREEPAGVLAFADAGEAYAVPVSHYWDEAAGRLVFRLGDDDHSRKLAYAATTTEASYVLYGVDDDGSWSVMARGSLVELDEEEAEAYDAATINERFDAFRVFDEDVADLEIRPFALDVRELTGRRTTA